MVNVLSEHLSNSLATMFDTPAELQLFGVYIPPLFLVCLLGLVCALAASRTLNRCNLSRCFWHPPLAFFALWVLASSLIGLLLIAP